MLLFAAKPAFDCAYGVSEHTLVGLLDVGLRKVIFTGSLPLCIVLLLGVHLILCPVEARDELLAADLPALVLIHDGEELRDALQVLLHQAFLKVAHHVLELLEADLATLVDIAGTKEFSWSHIPA